MKSDPKAVEWLNAQLTNELTGIIQYFLHAHTLRRCGVTLLGKHEHEESTEDYLRWPSLARRAGRVIGLFPNPDFSP